MNIIDFYKSILSAGSLVSDDEGYISASIRGTAMPFSVDGKRLVLPTREHLKNGDWSNRIAFHPLSENAMRPESTVLAKFRSAVNTKFNMVIGQLLTELLEIVLNVDIHPKLTPDQAELLTSIKDADEKTKNALISLISAMSKDNQEKCIVRLYLKRSAVVKGIRSNRAVIVTFPLYNELVKNDKQTYGVTLRNKDRLIIMHLLEYTIPDIEIENSMDYGSKSQIAPFLDSLMHGVMNIACRINTVVNVYSDYMSVNAEEYLYEDDWVPMFENLGQMENEIRSIPMLAGNEGNVKEQPPPATAPTYAVNPVQPQPQPQPALPMQYQPQQYQQPYQQQYQQQQPAPNHGQVINQTGTLNWSESLRNNPGVANIGNPMMNYQQPGPSQLRGSFDPSQYGMGGFNQPQYPQPYQQNVGFCRI
jgi:hypothetical protein